MLIIGLVDGRVLIRSAATMDLLAQLDGSFHKNQPVWSILNMGSNNFAVAGDSGVFVVFHLNKALAQAS